MRVPGLRSRIFGRSFRLMSGQQEHRDYGGLRKIGLEEVGLHERRLVGDALLRGVALRQRDHVRVVLDAEGARAALGGGDDGAPVAGAEVHHEVRRRDLGEVEHLVHQRLRRGHPDHVLAGLADLRLVVAACRLVLRERNGSGEGQDQRQVKYDAKKAMRSCGFSERNGTKVGSGIGRLQRDDTRLLSLYSGFLDDLRPLGDLAREEGAE